MTQLSTPPRHVAEWEPQSSTWLAWPHNESTWPGRYERIPPAYAALVRAFRRFVPVDLLAPDERTAEAVLARPDVGGDQPLRVHVVATNDAWVRDYGPLFIEEGGLTKSVTFRFDSWGGKYPYDLDDAAGRAIARILGLPRILVDRVLEGGSIDGDGEGTILTTSACLLRRHPDLGREGVERLFSEVLGARRVIWLGDGIAGDDTDGHVDDIARFVAPGVVVVAGARDDADADARALRANRALLRDGRDAAGRRLEVVDLPAPRVVVDDDGQRLPASYANFAIVDGGVVVPTFGGPEDDRAIAVLRELLPGREVVDVDTADLVLGLGGVHCLSLQAARPRST